MNPLLRRVLVGIPAGLLSGTALLMTLGHPLLSLVFGALVGACYSASLDPTRGTYVDNLMAGAALGVPLWGLVSVIGIPVLSGHEPEWNAEHVRSQFPALIGWVIYGAVLGFLTQAFNDMAARMWGPETASRVPTEAEKTRIVILGGGFGGMHTAQCLERQFRTNPNVKLTLISDTNALLFTPMLAEVAGSSLEPTHISTPLRRRLHRTEFIRGQVSLVDLDGRGIFLASDPMAPESSPVREVSYDHLVFALGAVSNYLGMVNLQKYSFNFKSLLDALRIRNHVTEMFERAARDPARRQALVT